MPSNIASLGVSSMLLPSTEYELPDKGGSGSALTTDYSELVSALLSCRVVGVSGECRREW